MSNTDNANKIRSVYVAGPYGARNFLREASQDLIRHGVVSTARWLNETYEVENATGAALELSDEQVKGHCDMDLEDVVWADAVFMFTGNFVEKNNMIAPGTPPGSGGRHFECGYAYALGKTVVIIGEPEHVFHRGNCIIVDSWEEALKLL